MYTFSPVDDMSQSHIGFWVTLVIASIIIAGSLYEELSSESVITTLFISAITIIVGLASFNDKAPLNEKVTAEFLHYQPEGFKQVSGKIRTDKHLMYVVYKLPDGNQIILQAAEGVVYPKQAILYKN